MCALSSTPPPATPPGFRHRAASLGIVTAFVLLGAWGCNRAPETESASVGRRDIAGILALRTNADVPPTDRADVTAPYSAPVAKVYTGVGDRVKKGDTLLELAASGAQAAYSDNRAAVKQAETALANAQKQYEANVAVAKKQVDQARIAEKAARNAAAKAVATATNPDNGADASGGENAATGMSADASGDVSGALQQAVTERLTAEQALIRATAARDAALAPYKQRLAQARQGFRGAQATRKELQVHAPITGEVLTFTPKPGQMIGEDAKAVIATIVDLSDIKAHAPLAPDQQPYVKEGTSVTLTFTALPNQTFAGKVAHISKQADPATQLPTNTMTLTFVNTKGMVKPGMAGTANIKLGEVKNVLAVPNGAIGRDAAGQPQVKVKNGNDWAPTTVEIGLSDGAFTEVKSGLKAGDVVQVVTRPT